MHSRARIILCSLLIRFTFSLIGLLVDYFQPYSLHYTDIDYQIYSDAAQFIHEGISPYERSTYRYPPLIALILVVNTWMRSSIFGKFVFCAFDTFVAAEIFQIDRVMASFTKTNSNLKWNNFENLVPCLWIFNPIAIVLCSRGSSDSISSYFILVSLRYILTSHHALSGLSLGLAIHLRLYPIIYSPAYFWFIKRQTSITSYPMLRFLLSVLTILLALNTICYMQYGDDYFQQSLIYHAVRTDHRHNFSMTFYWNYLQSSPSYLTVLQKLSSLSSVVSLNALIIHKYATAPLLPIGMLLQTMVFVTYNSVVTAQYFSWYLCFVPLLVQRWNRTSRWDGQLLKSGAIMSSLWIATCLGWLYNAYQLEFNGSNHYFTVWVCSALFFIVNVSAIHCIIVTT